MIELKLKKIIILIQSSKKFYIYLLLKILVSILSLVTNIFIVRKLNIYEYGIFSVVFMLIGLITTFGFSWSSSSLLYYGSREKIKYDSMNKTFWARNLIISFSLASVTMLFIIFKKQINNYVGLDISFLILIWLYVSVSEDYLSQYFLAIKKHVLSSMLSVTSKVIYLILIILIPFDVKTLIKLNIISHVTVLLYIFAIDKKDIDKFEFDKKWFKQVLNFSLWQLFGYSGLYLINLGDTAVIKHFMTTEDVGIYNAAYKLFNAIASFSFIISSYYASNVTTYLTSNNHRKIKQFFYKERFYILAMSTIAHVLVMIFAKPIITILYGERYIKSVVIFNILMVGSIFKIYRSILYAILQYE